MENQYNYYTTDQNMNTGNYGGGGEPGKEPQKKRGKGAARWAKGGLCRTGIWSGCKCCIFRRVILWQEKFLVQHRQRIKQLRQQRPAMQKLTTSTNSSIGTAKCNRGN